jgi:hypothetical protein
MTRNWITIPALAAAVSLRTRLPVLALGSWQKDLLSMRKTSQPAYQITTAPLAPSAATERPPPWMVTAGRFCALITGRFFNNSNGDAANRSAVQ